MQTGAMLKFIGEMKIMKATSMMSMATLGRVRIIETTIKAANAAVFTIRLYKMMPVTVAVMVIELA